MSAQANPTHSTLDAAKHEADLEEQRRKRKDSSVEISSTEGGEKMRQINLPTSKENDYPFDEAESQFKKRETNKALSVAEEVNE